MMPSEKVSSNLVQTKDKGQKQCDIVASPESVSIPLNSKGKAPLFIYLPIQYKNEYITYHCFIHVPSKRLKTRFIYSFFCSCFIIIIFNPCPAEPGYTLPLQTV